MEKPQQCAGNSNEIFWSKALEVDHLEVNVHVDTIEQYTQFSKFHAKSQIFQY